MVRFTAFLLAVTGLFVTTACRAPDAKPRNPHPVASPAASPAANPVASPVADTEDAPAIETDLETALARAAREHRPVFVHFTAEWCLPCTQLKETVYTDPAVAPRLAQFVRTELDIESPAGKRAALRYRVQTVPVLVMMDPAGEELRSLRVLGLRTPGQLAATLDNAIALSHSAKASDTAIH